MKKKIIFGIFLVAFLIMIIPSVPAVEYHTAVEMTNKSKFVEKTKDTEVLKQVIQQRINKLIQQDVSFKDLLCSRSSLDPDGPYIGGLDDPTDWKALFWGLMGCTFLTFSLKLLLKPENILQLIGGILGSFSTMFNILINFCEAFDILEYTMDGC